MLVLTKSSWGGSLKHLGKDLWLTVYLYFIFTLIFLALGFLYSTFFSYPSIRRDCLGLFTGQPIGPSSKKKRLNYKRVVARPSRFVRDHLIFHPPTASTVGSPNKSFMNKKDLSITRNNGLLHDHSQEKTDEQHQQMLESGSRV